MRLYTALAILLLSSPSVSGGIIVSTNTADFLLTAEPFAVTAGTNADLMSVSGNVTLDNAVGVGSPATGAHSYTAAGGVGALLPGAEYVLNGDENFDVIFSSPQLAFGMDYVDVDTDSVFTMTFFDGASNIGTTSFTSTAPFATVKFVGFISDAAFDKVEVRESDGVANSNEFFQFYSATAVPEPSGIGLLIAAAICAIGCGRKKRILEG